LKGLVKKRSISGGMISGVEIRADEGFSGFFVLALWGSSIALKQSKKEKETRNTTATKKARHFI